MRKRSRPKVVWLPGALANGVGDQTGMAQAGFVNFDASPSGSKGLIEFPLVQDGPQSSALDPNSSLSDIENSGYRLRRIVGKIYCTIPPSDPATVLGAQLIIVTAGIIVRRVNPENGLSLAFAVNGNMADPQNVTNEGDPWIWRKTWLLGDRNNIANFQDTTGTGFTKDLPPGSNWGASYAGGNAEGPHVDQKTARLVGPEERLFLDVSAHVIVEGGVGQSQLFVIHDLRCLATMRSNLGNRRNASR